MKHPVTKNKKLPFPAISTTISSPVSQEIKNATLQSVIENFDGYVWCIDSRFMYIIFNAMLANAVKEIFGVAVSPGDRVYDVLKTFDPAHSLEWEKMYETGFKGQRQQIVHEFSIKGQVFFFEMQLNPIKECGEVTGLCCFARDVTEEVVKRKQLDEFEIRFRSLVENSHAGISLLGSEGKVTYITPSVQGMMGYKNEELIGKDPLTFIHPDDKDKVRRVIRELDLKAGKTKRVIYRMQHKNGSWRWVSAALTNMLYCPEVKAIVINFEDATDRIIAEEELLKTAANLRSIFQNTDTGLMLIDTDFTIVAFNYKINEWIERENHKKLQQGVKYLDYVKDDKKDVMRRVLKDVLEGKKLRYQFRGGKVKGEGNWYEVSMQRITKENNIPIGINISTTDISKIKSSEEIIQKSEKLYRSLFNKSPLPKWVCDRRTLRYLEVNDKAVEHYGYTREEFLAMSAFELRPPEDHDELTELLHKRFAGEFRSSSVRHIKRNGEIIFVEVVAHPINYKNKEAFLVIAHDISKTLRLQRELMEEKINKQIVVTRATLDAQEKERSELGRELHDNVNQMLGTATLYLSYGLGHKKVQSEFVKKSMEIIHSAIDELRHLSKSLIPPSLVMGLKTAIDELIIGISLLTGMVVKTEIPFVNEEFISQGLKISIFRIIQEGLNNIIKYAAATEIKVAIDQQTDYLDLRIEDNGNGFDVNAKSNGIGLSNIINRAEAYNGNVNINSEPGKGCALHVRFKFA